MLKFLASLSSCKTILRIAEQRSVRGVKTRKSAGKPNAEWLVRERTVKSNSEKSSGSLNCFSFDFLTGLGIKANSTKCKSAMLICLTAFSSDYPPISDLIHLARCVKFNPQFNPWIVLIGLRGTEFNRRINLLRGFGRFNLGLALIGFRTTGARCRLRKLKFCKDLWFFCVSQTLHRRIFFGSLLICFNFPTNSESNICLEIGIAQSMSVTHKVIIHNFV